MKTILASLLAGSSAAFAELSASHTVVALAGFAASLSVTGVTLAWSARRAPVGWQDETGFHCAAAPSHNRPHSLGAEQKSSSGWIGFATKA